MSDVEAPAGGTPDAEANIQTNIDANRSAEIKEVSDKIEKVSAEIKEVSDRIEKVSDKIEKVSDKIEKVSADNGEERQRLIKKETDLMADKASLRSVLDGHLKEQSDLRSQLQELRGAGRRGNDGEEGQREAKMQRTDAGDGGVGAMTPLEQFMQWFQTLSGPFSVSGAPGPKDVIAGLAGLEHIVEGLKSQVESLKGLIGATLSQTRCASDISNEDFNHLVQQLQLVIREEEESIEEEGTIEEEGIESTCEAQLHFLGRAQEKISFWDHRSEPERLEECILHFRKVMPSSWNRGRNRILLRKSNEVTRLRHEKLPFPVSGKNDILFIMHGFVVDIGTILGIEIKKTENMNIKQNFHQAVVEWLLYSCGSVFPYVQILTDMESGGYALFLKGTDDKGRIYLTFKPLDTMQKVDDFVRNLFAALPADLGMDEGSTLVLPESLTDPVRHKLPPAIFGRKLGAQELLAICERLLQSDNDQDLVGFGGFNNSDDILSMQLPGNVRMPPTYIS